jgi:hypothetical protein
MKTYQESIKQSTPQKNLKKWRKRYKRERPKSRQKEETTNEGDHKGNMNESSTLNPKPPLPKVAMLIKCSLVLTHSQLICV